MQELRVTAMQMALGFPVTKLEDLIATATAIYNFLDGEVRIETTAPKLTRTKKATTPEPESEDDVDKELLAEVEPMPETGKAVVDAGTGKPAAAEGAPIQMTFDDVKKAAAKLAAKDVAKLGEILKSYSAAKLSDVPGPKLGDFAADVMEALG